MTDLRPRVVAGSDVPTRIRADLRSQLENKIQELVWEVEKVGASAALTDVVNLLSKARDRLADHLEGVDVDVQKA